MRDNFWRFYCNANEGGSLLLENRLPYPLEKDQFYFVPANVSFKCHCAQEVDHFYVHFDIAGLPRVTLQKLFNAPIQVPQTAALLAMYEALLQDLTSGRATLAIQLRFKALMYEALVLCLAGADPEQVKNEELAVEQLKVIQPALDYVEMHLSEHTGVTELAELCNMSKDYFIRRFRQYVGITPLQYILQRRVRCAAQALLHTSKTIDDIAELTGFGNRYYFTRAFKKVIGVSPAHYRKMRPIQPIRE